MVRKREKRTAATEIRFSQFSSVQLLSRVRLFATPWIAARQTSQSITNSRSSLRLTSIDLYTNHEKCMQKWTFWIRVRKKYYVLRFRVWLLLLLLLSHFSRVQPCATPETAAHQAPPSLGFSRQEHWSGLPFPSPMQESEKWKWSRSVVSDS